MTTTDIVNLALNIGLGVISLILSIFAIWLSLRFNDSSNSALDSIKDLSREIKALVQISLSQQNSFSNKMLDSIIEQNRFSRSDADISQPSPTFEAIIQKSLDSAEQNITTSVEKKVREIIKSGTNDPKSIESGMKTIRSNIQELSGIIKDQASTVDALRSFLHTPAYYVLLAAIIKSGAQTQEEVENVVEKYTIPEGWEMGILRLIEKGLLQGTEDKFEVAKENRQLLDYWVNLNWRVLNRLMKSYAEKSNEKGITDQERKIALSLRF